MYEYNAECVRVIDGYTLDAMIDLGFSTWKRVRIRLDGIDTSSSITKNKDKKYKAKERLEEIVDLNDNKFHLKVNSIGKYGKAFGEVLVSNVGRSAEDSSITMCNVNNQLIKEGYVVGN